MNYQSGAALMCGFGVDGSMPIGIDWRRVNFALAGYGYLVPGSFSEPAPLTCESSVVRTCNATSSIEVA